MAVLDPRNDTVVIRVVYDGAPMAGKSTSVGALGRGLGSNVYSPGEVSGRTLYFDWLDYTGGLFEGRRIRCQIISVPGQATLAPRRRRLLESADAIVFVGDSSLAVT
jgi:GTPase SAR1 family protein